MLETPFEQGFGDVYRPPETRYVIERRIRGVFLAGYLDRYIPPYASQPALDPFDSVGDTATQLSRLSFSPKVRVRDPSPRLSVFDRLGPRIRYPAMPHPVAATTALFGFLGMDQDRMEQEEGEIAEEEEADEEEDEEARRKREKMTRDLSQNHHS